MDDKKTIETADNVSEMSECEIDQSVVDSFPASDPPSWTLGTDHVHTTRRPDPNQKPK